jgi:hypothetical protein
MQFGRVASGGVGITLACIAVDGIAGCLNEHRYLD